MNVSWPKIWMCHDRKDANRLWTKEYELKLRSRRPKKKLNRLFVKMIYSDLNRLLWEKKNRQNLKNIKKTIYFDLNNFLCCPKMVIYSYITNIIFSMMSRWHFFSHDPFLPFWSWSISTYLITSRSHTFSHDQFTLFRLRSVHTFRLRSVYTLLVTTCLHFFVTIHLQSFSNDHLHPLVTIHLQFFCHDPFVNFRSQPFVIFRTRLFVPFRS